jgi:hypothetical protein
MSRFKNSEVAQRVLRTLVSKIGRRTSEGYAVVVLGTILGELVSRYGFLRCIKVKNTSYSEGFDAVTITSGINAVNENEFYGALNEIIRRTIRYLEGSADFFFIKEFKEALGDMEQLLTLKGALDLDLMQSQYIVDRKKTLKIECSEIMERALRALVRVVNKRVDEQQAIQTIIKAIDKLRERYRFLQDVLVSDKLSDDVYHVIKIDSAINNIHQAAVAEAIQRIVEEVGKLSGWKNNEAFITSLKQELGEEGVSRLRLLGVNLEGLKTVLLRKGHMVVVKKALDELFRVVSKRMSRGFAVVTLHMMVEKLQDKHDVFRYIIIDRDRYLEGVNAIKVTPEINNVESYKIGRALRDLIKLTNQSLEGSRSFVEDFKKQLGEEYHQELERLGVNLHFLELKFAETPTFFD